MSREDLKDIIKRVIESLQQEQNDGDSPSTACLFYDKPPCDNCDATTKYAIGEEG